MDNCGRLIGARSLYAWFDSTRKMIIVAADVAINPLTTEAHICPNPLARILPPPDAREFLVEAVNRPHAGITPAIEVVMRIHYSYSSDATPKAVRIYTMGIDNPTSTDVPVAGQPPSALQPAATASSTSAPPPAASASREKVEGVGWSQTHSFDEALKAAMQDLGTKLPPMHPDISVSADIVKMTTRFRGNMMPGLEIIIRG
jgi:hypothetical protein